jgi:hypothetical protein
MEAFGNGASFNQLQLRLALGTIMQFRESVCKQCVESVILFLMAFPQVSNTFPHGISDFGNR